MNRRDAGRDGFASIQEAVRTEMFTWQITVLLAVAGCAIGCLLVGCLLGIWRVTAKLTKGILSIGAELTKLNAKIERIEAVNRDDPKKPMDRYGPDPSFEDIEAAISNFEKLKRIDLTKS